MRARVPGATAPDGRRRTARGERPVAPASGSRTMNSLPRAGPVAVRRAPCRRAARPGCARASGRCRGPPCDRSSACAPCDEQVEDVAAGPRARCRCRCRGRDARPRRPRARARHGDRAARRRVLGGVGQQVGEHLRQARRVAVDAQARAAARRPSACVLRCSSSGLAISTACATTSRELDGLRFELDLAARDARRRRAGRRPAASGARPGAR